MTERELNSRADSLAKLWTKFRPRVLAKVAVLEQAARAQRDGTLDEPLRGQAEREAHRLAGSLGSLDFGKATSTELTLAARAIEEHFGSAPGRQESLDVAALIRGLRERLESVPWDDPDAVTNPGDADTTTTGDR